MLMEYINVVTHTINQIRPNYTIKLLFERNILWLSDRVSKQSVIYSSFYHRINKGLSMYQQPDEISTIPWKREVEGHAFLTSALDGSEWSAYFSGAPGTCWTGGCVGLKVGLDVAMNRLCPPLGIEPWFPAHSAHSQVIILSEISWH